MRAKGGSKENERKIERGAERRKKDKKTKNDVTKETGKNGVYCESTEENLREGCVYAAGENESENEGRVREQRKGMRKWVSRDWVSRGRDRERS